MTAFVLVLVMRGYNVGPMVYFQEFTSRANCELVLEKTEQAIQQKRYKDDIILAYCAVK